MKSWLSGALILISLTFFGLVFGALVATRILTPGGMGFDQIADALGGAIVGGIIALVAGVALIRRLSASSRVLVALLAIAASGGAVFYLRATPMNVRGAESSNLATSLVGAYRLGLQTSDPFEESRGAGHGAWIAASAPLLCRSDQTSPQPPTENEAC